MTRDRHHEAGLSLVEVTLVATLLALVIGVVGVSAQTASTSLGDDDRVARAMENLQRSMVRISHIMRPCSISTYRYESTAADVPLLASSPGEWIEPVDGVVREAVQFQSASGVLSMNATALTAPRVIRLELDDGEIDNGIDDDGDGMIDEGRVTLDYDGVVATMARNIENITFTLTGRVIDIDMHAAVRRRDGSVQRFALHETLFLRNN